MTDYLDHLAMKYTKILAASGKGMNFSEFESLIVEKFEDDSDRLNIQELFTCYID